MNQVAKALSEYQTSRAAFVESVRCLLAKEDGGRVKKALFDADVVGLLCRPLIQDVVPSIQIASLATLGKVAHKGRAHLDGSQLTSHAILDSVVTSLVHQSRRVRLQANEALQSISGQGVSSAIAVKNAGALIPLLLQLEDTDDELNRSAVKTINVLINILTRSDCGEHGENAVANADLAAEILSEHTLSLLIGHLDTSTEVSSMALKAAIVALLADACSTGMQLTSKIVEAGGMASVCYLITDKQATTALLADSFRCLGHIASYTDDLAMQVVDCGVMRHTARALTSQSPPIRRSASRLAYELSSKTADMAERMASDGSIEMEGADHKLEAVPSILALGHMSSFKERLANMIVEAKGIETLVSLLSLPSPGIDTLSAASWAITQLARYGPETSLAVANASALPSLMNVYSTSVGLLAANVGSSSGETEAAQMARLTMAKQSVSSNGVPQSTASDAHLSMTQATAADRMSLQDTGPTQIRDLHAKVRVALETCITLCPEAAALEPLLVTTSGVEILATVTKRLAQLLQESVDSKKTFITSGGLMRLQAIARQYEGQAAAGSCGDVLVEEDGSCVRESSLVAMMMQDVRTINASFPEAIVQYYQG